MNRTLPMYHVVVPKKMYDLVFRKKEWSYLEDSAPKEHILSIIVEPLDNHAYVLTNVSFHGNVLYYVTNKDELLLFGSKLQKVKLVPEKCNFNI